MKKDILNLENKKIKPTFIPDVEQDLNKYFNVQEGKQAISDTYIPRENRKIVESN